MRAFTAVKPFYDSIHQDDTLLSKFSQSTGLMVGNDPVNDMIAAHTGMKTYLTFPAQSGLPREEATTHYI